MRDNPIHFFLQTLTGSASDQIGLGFMRWVVLAQWWLLLAGGIGIAVHVWRQTPAQRTPKELIIFASRFVAGAMWYLATLWKLPWPVSDGFQFWLDNTVKFSSFQWHADIMQVFDSAIFVVQPLVYLLELFIAASLMFGVFVRVGAVLAALFTFNLLIGLYNDPTEWAWTYIAIIYGHVMFAATQAGRSLGLDHLLAKGLVPQRFVGLSRRLAWAG